MLICIPRKYPYNGYICFSYFQFLFQTDHTEELEELCQAPNHINESGGESGGEFWLSTATGQDDPNANPGAKIEPSENNTSVSDLVVI